MWQSQKALLRRKAPSSSKPSRPSASSSSPPSHLWRRLLNSVSALPPPMGVEREKEALWPRELSSAHRAGAGGGGRAALSQSRRRRCALRSEFTVLLQLPSAAAMVKSWLQDGRGFWKKILLLLFSKYQLTKHCSAQKWVRVRKSS